MIQERILKCEQQILSGSDRAFLVAKRNKQLLFLLSAYVPFVLILLYVYLMGPGVLYRDEQIYPKKEVTEDDVTIFNAVAPYTCGFFFLLLTGYFIYQYCKSVAPLIKDLRNNKKNLLYTSIEKSEMAVFNRYYITTPIRKKQMIRVNMEDFYKIRNEDPLVFEVAPRSMTILGVKNNLEDIIFYLV